MVSEKMLLNVARLRRDSITQQIDIEDLEHRLSIFNDQQIATVITKGHVKTLARLISLLCALVKTDHEKAIILGYKSVDEWQKDRQRMINDIKNSK